MATLAVTHNVSLRSNMISCASPRIHKMYPFSSIRFPQKSTLNRKALDRSKRQMKVQAMATGNKEGVLVQKVTAREFERILRKERTMPFVVDFYAAWCGTCITMAQEVELLAVEYARRVRFLKVDTDEEYEFAQQMEVRGLPTLVYIGTNPNEPAVRMEGTLSRPAIRNVINARLKVFEDASEDALMEL